MKTKQTISLAGVYSTDKKGFVARCSEIFRLQDEKTPSFGAGLRALTHEDKLELCEAFNDAGLPTDPPMVAAS